MSDFRAIGGVSATLQTILLDRMERPDQAPPDVHVTVGSPRFGSKENEPADEHASVNLFLYRVTEHGFLQNQEIPGRGSPDGYGHPPLSLKLHYLLTTYGRKKLANGTADWYDETLAHFLLGSAMRVLHDFPIITGTLTTISAPSGRQVLHPSLRDEFEKIKLTLDPLTLEDITKVWTALGLRYRLSAAYLVSVVQIESRRPRRFARPVGAPNPPYPPAPGASPGPGPHIEVITLRTPMVTGVKVRRPATATIESEFSFARIGDAIILVGTDLGGDSSVELGDLVLPAVRVQNDRVEAVVPDTTIPGQGAIPPDQILQPGPIGAGVVIKEPALPHSWIRSSRSAMMLVPLIATVTPPTVGSRQVRLQGKRLYHPTRGGETVIGRHVIPASAYLRATAPTVTPAQDDITAPVPDTMPMRDVRVLVSGSLGTSITLATQDSIEVFVNGTSAGFTQPLDGAVTRSREEIPALMEALMRDVAPDNAAMAGLRVGLLGDRLVILAGGMSATITVAAVAGSTMPAVFKLTATQPAGAANGLISGELSPFPVLTAPHPGIGVRIGAPAIAETSLGRPATLDEAATMLEAAIHAADPAAPFQNTTVGVVGRQLIVIPGAAQAIRFSPATGDPTTAAELQLKASFDVRVRVNGAESLDPVSVDLPEP